MSSNNKQSNAFWLGDLTPHLEHGRLVEEEYDGVTSKLLADEVRDYLRFDVFPSETQIEHFYDYVYPSTRRHQWYNAENQYLASRWESVIERIISLTGEMGLAPAETRIHDAGCGFGGLVGNLRDRNFDATGTDLSVEAIEGGRSERQNASIHHERAESFLARGPKQHVIVLNHMIEHASDPLRLISDLVGYLEPGGCILIRCPNSQFLRCTQDSIRANWYGYPKHLHYFGPQSLAALVRVAGLSRVLVAGTDTDMRIPGELALLSGAARQAGLTFESPEELIKTLVARQEAKELEAVGWLG